MHARWLMQGVGSVTASPMLACGRIAKSTSWMPRALGCSSSRRTARSATWAACSRGASLFFMHAKAIVPQCSCNAA